MVRSTEKIVVVKLKSEDWARLCLGGKEQGEMAFTINLRDPEFTRQVLRIAVLVVGTEVSALGLGRSVGWSGDLDTGVRFVHVQDFQPVRMAQIIEAMNLALGGVKPTALEDGGILAPATNQRFFDALFKLRPECSKIMEDLRALQCHRLDAMSDQRRLFEEQRDAVALSLEVAGIDSIRALHGWDDTSAYAPFLSGLSIGRSSEASFIRHDANNFEDWLRIDGRIHDVVEFFDDRNPGRRITIAYADKEPLERVTGTDLIYYRHHSPGYVLVQYKRMRHEDGDSSAGGGLYRPDHQLEVEIDRMRKFKSDSSCEGVDQWRLSSEPCYIKLCEDQNVRPEGRKLTRGLYFPLGLFQQILESPEILGPKGGKSINWHNAQRWLSNTMFIELLREGWIGSAGNVTDEITALVRQALEGGRGVTLARDESETTHYKRPRDRKFSAIRE